MDRAAYLDRTRDKGVSPLVYWLVRAVLQPFFHVWFRLSRIGREHIPAEGGFILAANHRSFLDPFVIACMARRPIYFVAKQELFERPLQAWFLNALGAFPIDRGAADADAMGTAREILERGDGVLIFPEGTRNRPGPLGDPKRGVGRLALETGVPVIPVAIIGTDFIRRGWRVRPHKVRIRAGRPLRFPHVEHPSAALAGAVTERIWPNVALQWEWLGGTAPVRRAVVVGFDDEAAGLASALHAAGVEVVLASDDRAIAAGLEQVDLVVLACGARALPGVMAAHGARIPAAASVAVVARGLVVAGPGAPDLPVEHVAQRCAARAVAALAGPPLGAGAVELGGMLVVASADAGLSRTLATLLGRAGLDVAVSRDVTGVQLAATAAVVAGLAAATAGPGTAHVAGAKAFGEIEAWSRTRGGRPETFLGAAGTGTLLAGAPEADADQTLQLLAVALTATGRRAPVVAGLAAVMDGRAPAADWAARVARPGARSHKAA